MNKTNNTITHNGMWCELHFIQEDDGGMAACFYLAVQTGSEILIQRTRWSITAE